jgi:Holliday junction resolvase RusA-like endonuclease
MKSRKNKQKLYDKLYNHIPKDYNERLEWMVDQFNLTPMKMDSIIGKYNTMKKQLYYKRFFIILYEIPEGSPRPRFRLVNRKNLRNIAIANPNFIHVYSPVGAEDHKFMKQLLTKQDFRDYNKLIYTPCIVNYKAFFKTPSSFNSVEKYLAELGVYNPISKPDWDNIGKKYCDMTNENIWVDDRLVIKGTVEKYYSILPRVEITIDYLNMLQNKQQAESLKKIFKNDIRYFGDGRDE